LKKKGFWELPANCISGEEYEEWLRTDKSKEENESK